MSKEKLFVGDSPLKFNKKKVGGEYITIASEIFYKISNVDQMAPFFMSIVSDSDHWMYIWSNGALTAGRKNSDQSLFPYYTDDKIRDSAEITGSKTILLIESDDSTLVWEPFSNRYAGIYNIDRNCYKNIYGNKLIFEEINHDLQIAFLYAWLNGDKFGFIKRSILRNHGNKKLKIKLLDGIQNILPAGVQQTFQNEFSTLVDAYKKSELETDSNLGIYYLSSIPVDRAEPSEALKATTVWSAGIDPEQILLSAQQLADFRQGLAIEQETSVRAVRGAYFIKTRLDLPKKDSASWYIVAEIDQDLRDVVQLKMTLRDKQKLLKDLEDNIAAGTDNLKKIMAKADGLQKSEDLLNTSRHFSNVLFNSMRGGIFCDNYLINRDDFIKFLKDSNKQIYENYKSLFFSIPEQISHSELIVLCNKQNEPGLEKLCYEYLPLTFSRRHGDPSRPWNRFSIDIKDDHGNPVLNYQGNWRDIFQNWEALAFSFPEFIESMITKFVNASTADGYNPYRLTREGFDWEILDPHDPWSYIGYWGDHQIIYLLKLLELSQKYHPGKLISLLEKNIYAYAHVPYRIKSFEDILKDPFDTVDFDQNLEREIEKQVAEIGSDGKFIYSPQGGIYQVNLTEKLLVPVLTKVSNFIPEAGIWLNTQRPEWNDANNALVGNGVSMVTLYYLRRHLDFLAGLFQTLGDRNIQLSEEVALFQEDLAQIYTKHQNLLKGAISDKDRKAMLEQVGRIGSTYRLKIYEQGFSGKKIEVTFERLSHLCILALRWIDHSILANQREDKLYHAYNLINKIDQAELSIRHLYEMLEGQVAVLSSGFLSAEQALIVLKALRRSKLYREDQLTYILYPNRELARFVEKNNIPPALIEKSELLRTLIAKGDQRIVIQDVSGGVHFNSTFRNGTLLKKALDRLMMEDDLKTQLQNEQQLILQIYEDLFDHKSFTGRSGTFFKYEGLGSIYWHMVSKLLLAVQENYYRAVETSTDPNIVSQLREHYYEIKKGIGVHKSPDRYGGFPTDPYSHTPNHTGAQQPGMTGQVKEDIISRFGELGLIIKEGRISFHKGLLNQDELLSQPASFKYIDILGNEKSINLSRGNLAFTFCQIPMIYHTSLTEKIVLTESSGETLEIHGLGLNAKYSRSIFKREGKIQKIDIHFHLT